MSSVRREDLLFTSGGSRCAAWLYLPEREPPAAVVLMAHGLGGQRRFRLDAYAERFGHAGMAALVFDYRHFGDSEGEPRQLVSIRRQLADWRAAVACARSHPSLEGAPTVVWGTSLGAGHVLAIAAGDDYIAAAIAQVPLVDGFATSRAVGLRQALRLGWAANRDRARALFSRPPYRVRIFGPPGSLAAIVTPGAEEAIRDKLLPPGDWDETMPARIFASLPYYRPSRHAARVRCPILFQVADYDRVSPHAPALKAAARAPRAELKRYPIDHFDIYAGEAFERAVGDQIEFLTRHLESARDGVRISGPPRTAHP